jgi:hypothetical protein
MVDPNMYKQINRLQNKYNKVGTVLIKTKSILSPVSNNNFKDLEECCEKVEKEFIKIGDAGEQNHLLVGRFMTDVKKPKIVKNPYSKKVLKILNQKKYISLFKKILGIENKKNIYLRRVQFNQIDKDCFVGYHLDKDSNPDYLAAGVIQFGKNFKGGKYRVYQSKKNYIDYTPTTQSLIISDCNFPHEVTRVTKGNRKSLVFFISEHLKNNRRKN